MKSENFKKRYYFLNALVVILSILEGIIALIAYRYYAYAARGILGIVTLYLLYYYGKSTKMDKLIDTLSADSSKGKYLISMFIYGVISVWAVIQVAAALLFYLQK
jgi:uncharacterized membrane protein